MSSETARTHDWPSNWILSAEYAVNLISPDFVRSRVITFRIGWPRPSCSRREYKPLAWIPELLSLRARIEEATPAAAYANLRLPKLGYNAVLCNLYRNGNDSVGLHADAEPEMGPVIASVSLGAERLFRLKGQDGTVVFAERLPHGSLFVMAGRTQKNFRHEVPKEPDVAQPRINLTFRRIEHK